MKKIKAIETKKGKIILYQVLNEYVVLKVVTGLEMPSLPTTDLNMALSIFDLWNEELNSEKNH